MIPTLRFLGVDFTPLDLDAAVRAVAAPIEGSPFKFVVTPNAHHLVAGRRGDTRFTDAQASAFLVLNDSRMLRLLARVLFGQTLPLAAGSDLTAALFDRVITPSTPITIIGGDEVVERRLRERFGLRRIARHNPSFGFWRNPDEIAECVGFVEAHPARFVFFCVGAPQSEALALACSERPGLNGVGLCVGSSLNFVTGVVRRAPLLIRAACIEGLWRLALNPKGHFRRVFVDSLPIVWIAFSERLACRTR